MSSVYYKFKNQRGSSRVDFDGPYIAYDQLKREIIRRSLHHASDLDLKIVDEQTRAGDALAMVATSRWAAFC